MSVVMRSQRAFSEEKGRLPPPPHAAAVAANIRSCNCCPYGYHIDLDFVRYCEALANAKPSEEELRRRSRRRSRKSMEFMLGFESLFDQWDAAERVHALPELPHESEPDSPRLLQATPRPRSSSVPRFTYGGLGPRSESPFGTASSTCSSLRGTDSDATCFPGRRPANSPPETRAFLHDALDEVCSDFERTLERASVKRKKGVAGGGGGTYSIRNKDQKAYENGFSYSGSEKRNGYTWSSSFDVFDNLDHVVL